MSETLRVDARGLSCPEPVMLAKQAMRREGVAVVEVLTDSVASRDNVRRAAEMAGRTVSVEELVAGEYRLRIEL